MTAGLHKCQLDIPQFVEFCYSIFEILVMWHSSTELCHLMVGSTRNTEFVIHIEHHVQNIQLFVGHTAVFWTKHAILL